MVTAAIAGIGLGVFGVVGAGADFAAVGDDGTAATVSVASSKALGPL